MRYLLAIDSSDQAFDAVRVLTHLSPCEHTILLHAVDVPKASYPMLDPEAAHELYRSLELDMREEGKRLLQRAVTRCPTAWVRWRVVLSSARRLRSLSQWPNGSEST